MGVEEKKAQLYLGSKPPSSDALRLLLLLVVFRAFFHETYRSGKIAFLLTIRTTLALTQKLSTKEKLHPLYHQGGKC